VIRVIGIVISIFIVDFAAVCLVVFPVRVFMLILVSFGDCSWLICCDLSPIK